MKRIVLGLVLVVAACGPNLTSGIVLSKSVEPAHEEQYLMPMYAGETCTGGRTTVCTPNFIYIPQTRHVPDRCYLTIKHEEDQGTVEVACGRSFDDARIGGVWRKS